MDVDFQRDTLIKLIDIVRGINDDIRAIVELMPIEQRELWLERVKQIKDRRAADMEVD